MWDDDRQRSPGGQYPMASGNQRIEAYTGGAEKQKTQCQGRLQVGGTQVDQGADQSAEYEYQGVPGRRRCTCLVRKYLHGFGGGDRAGDGGAGGADDQDRKSTR